MPATYAPVAVTLDGTALEVLCTCGLPRGPHPARERAHNQACHSMCPMTCQTGGIPMQQPACHVRCMSDDCQPASAGLVGSSLATIAFPPKDTTLHWRCTPAFAPDPRGVYWLVLVACVLLSVDAQLVLAHLPLMTTVWAPCLERVML
jgi:hypothetical protein